jgi:hypothetical protein
VGAGLGEREVLLGPVPLGWGQGSLNGESSLTQSSQVRNGLERIVVAHRNFVASFCASRRVPF